MSMTEKKDGAVSVPLHYGEKECPATAEQSFFRGESIGWLTVPTAVTKNAIGDSEASNNKENWILFRSNRYKKEGFYKMAYP